MGCIHVCIFGGQAHAVVAAGMSAIVSQASRLKIPAGVDIVILHSKAI